MDNLVLQAGGVSIDAVEAAVSRSVVQSGVPDKGQRLADFIASSVPASLPPQPATPVRHFFFLPQHRRRKPIFH